MYYSRFIVNNYGADELLNLFNPQILCVSNKDLNENEWPAMESLERASILTSEIYLCYNSLAVYIFVGAQADPWFV